MIYSFARSCRAGNSVNCEICRNLKHCGANFSSKSKERTFDATSIEHYRVLGLKSNADQESVRKAFINLCKKYHPDSGSPEADGEKFQEVEKAYRFLQNKFISERWDLKYKQEEKIEEEVEQFDIKHTAPQHRQYLSWGGIGSGTPSQRQHQYSQLRAAQAQERVMEHKLKGLERTGDAISVQDRRRVNKTKTRFGMERMVEDLIQESMAKGDFDNLTGAGKPLRQQNFNPHLDFVTHKMNEIMIENGFTPAWITLAREIEQDTENLRKDIYENCHFQDSSPKWSKILANLETSKNNLNKKIQLFNLIVPILNRQKLLFRLEVEFEKARLLPRAQPVETSKTADNNSDNNPVKSDSILFGMLGTIFRSS